MKPGDEIAINNPYLYLINCLSCYFTFFIIYQLAMAFVGISPPVKQILLPILIASVIGYISKIYLGASASIQTSLVVLLCTGLLHLFNRVNFLISLVGSLLTMITLTLGSMFLACPIFIQLGYTLPVKLGATWLLLNLLELIIPILALVILKTTGFSLNRVIYTKY